MAVNTSAALAPREEIAAAIMEGSSLNKTLIWQDVLPPLGLDQRTAHLPKLTIANAELHRIITDLSAPGADIPRMQAGIGELTLNTAIRKQEIGIPVEAEMDYAQVFSLQTFYSKVLGEKALSLTLEYLAMSALFNTTNFGAATNSATAYTAANLATISLVSDLLAALNRVRDAGEEPNAVIIPAAVYERATQSDLVKGWVVGQLGSGADISIPAIESALKKVGFDVKVSIGRAQYNSGAKGVKTLTRVWPNTYIWVGRAGYKNETTDEGIPTIDGVGCTAFWTPYGLMAGEAYEDKPKEQIVVRGKLSGNPTIFNASAGTLIATQFA